MSGDHTIARALFSFSAAVQESVMAHDWPTGWEWHMHPGTWIRIKADIKSAAYITMDVARDVLAADDLFGCPVIIDARLPVGAVEFRFAAQAMLPMA